MSCHGDKPDKSSSLSLEQKFIYSSFLLNQGRIHLTDDKHVVSRGLLGRDNRSLWLNDTEYRRKTKERRRQTVATITFKRLNLRNDWSKPAVRDHVGEDQEGNPVKLKAPHILHMSLMPTKNASKEWLDKNSHLQIFFSHLKQNCVLQIYSTVFDRIFSGPSTCINKIQN